MAVNKYFVAGGVALAGVATLAVATTYCGWDFAEAVAEGDFERAERRAGLLAVNEILATNWAACGFVVAILGVALIALAYQ